MGRIYGGNEETMREESSQKVIRDDDHQAHLKAHEKLIKQATSESVMIFLDEILCELIAIRKAVVKANKPKRKKK
jgi:hypothetical protein